MELPFCCTLVRAWGRALRGRTRAPQRRMAEARGAADKEETSSFQGNILKENTIRKTSAAELPNQQATWGT